MGYDVGKISAGCLVFKKICEYVTDQPHAAYEPVFCPADHVSQLVQWYAIAIIMHNALTSQL